MASSKPPEPVKQTTSPQASAPQPSDPKEQKPIFTDFASI